MESADLRAVRYTISNSPMKQIFGGNGQTALSQGVLLSLIQQLSMFLIQPNTDTCDTNSNSSNLQNCLNWMEECLMSLEPDSELISVHVKQVFPGILERLNECLRGAEPQFKRQLKMIQHLTRSLLQ